jgi:Rrf2 family iron-sulfur cluster assembly transcriptional regulator
LWEDLSQQIHDFLHGISLADLMARQDVRRISSYQDERRELIVKDLRLIS